MFCCRDFLEVFLTDDTRPTWSQGTLFPVKQSASGTYTSTGPQHLVIWMNPIRTSFQSNPMAVIVLMVNTCEYPPASYQQCYVSRLYTYHDLPLHWLKQHVNNIMTLLVDPFLFSSFPSHTVAATHLL